MLEQKPPTGPDLSASYPANPTFELLAGVFENCPDGILVGPPDGPIWYANPAACAIFGTSENDLRALGRAGLGDSEHPHWDGAVLRPSYQEGAPRALVPMARADGSRFLAEVASVSLDASEGRLKCTILRDVTDRVRKERRLAAYDEIAEALLGRRDVAAVLALVAKHARLIFSALAAIITKVEANERLLVMAADGTRASALVGRTYPLTGVGTATEPLFVDNFAETAVSDDGRGLGVGPAIVVPIVSGGQVFGNLFVGGPLGTTPFNADDMAAARQFALRAGVVLSLGQAREDLERRQQKTSDQLQRALDTRIPIEQAKGFLAGTRNIGTDEAFDRLRRYARSHSTDIHDIAQRVLERTLFL
jgi:PAS domain S-box-containing protein